jgi:hypothetical protein
MINQQQSDNSGEYSSLNVGGHEAPGVRQQQQEVTDESHIYASSVGGAVTNGNTIDA